MQHKVTQKSFGFTVGVTLEQFTWEGSSSELRNQILAYKLKG